MTDADRKTAEQAPAPSTAQDGEDRMAENDTLQQELLVEHEKIYNSFIKNSVRATAAVLVVVALVVFFAIV